MKILLLENDKICSKRLRDYLQIKGFKVDSVFDGESVYLSVFENRYDLYIFDTHSPDEDGFTILQELRSAGDFTPALFISLDTNIDSISKGFAVGAEDYIKRPFDPEELFIRIKSRYLQIDTIKYKNIIYNPKIRKLQKDNNIVFLGDIQSNIFHKFITNIDKVITFEELLELLDRPNSNALRVNLAKLKSKLDLDIKNIRGQGYILEKTSI
jgi:DNA-binding response OmpR family regulator